MEGGSTGAAGVSDGAAGGVTLATLTGAKASSPTTSEPSKPALSALGPDCQPYLEPVQ